MPNFWDELAEEDEKAKAIGKTNAAKLKKAQEQIRGGGTNGDRLQDYVLLNYGYAPDILDKLRVLDAGLRTHAHELILIVERDERNRGCTDIGAETDPMNHQREEWLNLAFIEPGGLRVTRTQSGTSLELDLPIGEQVVYQTTRLGGEIERVEAAQTGRSFFRMPFATALDKPIIYVNPMSRDMYEDDTYLECLVGKEAGEAWFEPDSQGLRFLGARPPVNLYRQMHAALLGLSVPA